MKNQIAHLALSVANVTMTGYTGNPFVMSSSVVYCTAQSSSTADYSKNLHPPGDPNEVDVAFHIEDLTGVCARQSKPYTGGGQRVGSGEPGVSDDEGRRLPGLERLQAELR